MDLMADSFAAEAIDTVRNVARYKRLLIEAPGILGGYFAKSRSSFQRPSNAAFWETVASRC
jgi:hypothetical protein